MYPFVYKLLDHWELPKTAIINCLWFHVQIKLKELSSGKAIKAN